jgi:DNA-binding transcriptional regulator YiaG
MDISQYLKATGMPKVVFARLMEISISTLSNYVAKRRKPNLVIAHRMVTRTKGKITIEDLLK